MHPSTPLVTIGAGPEPSQSPRPSNPTAWKGFWMVLAAAVLSPLSFLGVPFLFLFPLGIAGLVVCAVALRSRPRWPGVVGIVIGLSCLGFWAGLFAKTFWNIESTAARNGMTIAQHAAMSMTAMELFECAEAQRAPDGTPAASFDWTVVPSGARNDPWGQPLQYVVQPSTARGYTFFSNGPDGAPWTRDDIDLSAIGDRQTFQLPPIKRPKAP